MRQGELSITPLTPRIGAEIAGVDLREPLGDNQIGALKQALADHLVLFFRDQPIDHAAHKRFGRAFGDLALHSAVPGIDGHPEIVAIHADAESKFIAGEHWHSDLTCDAEPPLGSILYLHTVPETGGDTLFASMYAAYEALSPRMQVYLDGLTAIHDADHVYRPLFPDVDRKYPCSVHPVVRVHPETGERALLLGGFAQRLVGHQSSESVDILRTLQAYVTRPENTVRWHWHEGDVAVWDNRSTQHYAIYDYGSQHRRVQRVTTEGAVPVGLDGRESVALQGDATHYYQAS